MKPPATEAIVLRSVDYSETSLVVHLFTRDYGRVAALARGARRLRSYRAGALDLLCVCRIVLRRRGGRGLDLLHEAQLIEAFAPLELPYPASLAGFAVARLLFDFTSESQPQPALFERAVGALRRIRSHGDWELPLHRFVWELVVLSGYEPRLDRCARCFDRPRGPSIRFCPLAGGVLCEGCLPLSRVATCLSPGTLKTLQHLVALEADTWHALRIDGSVRRELWQVETATVQALTERPVEVLRYLAASAVGHRFAAPRAGATVGRG